MAAGKSKKYHGIDDELEAEALDRLEIANTGRPHLTRTATG
jgi:hypothetical protein